VFELLLMMLEDGEDLPSYRLLVCRSRPLLMDISDVFIPTA